jgi:hypothetical protein
VLSLMLAFDAAALPSRFLVRTILEIRGEVVKGVVGRKLGGCRAIFCFTLGKANRRKSKERWSRDFAYFEIANSSEGLVLVSLLLAGGITLAGCSPFQFHARQRAMGAAPVEPKHQGRTDDRG